MSAAHGSGSDPATAAPHVVVVGAGIAGLAAAHALRTPPEPSGGPVPAVTVVEAAPEVGGKLRLLEVGGVTVDAGAEALLARRPEAVELTRAVGLGAELEHPATTRSVLWSRGALRPMPGGHLMGIPLDLDAVAAGGVLSAEAMARLEADLRLPDDRPGPPDGDGEDVPLGERVAQRLGDEVVDRLVEPLLGGVYAGHAREVSTAMVLPQLLGPLRAGGSLIRAARAVQDRTPRTSGPVFAGIRGGVGRLPGAVAAASGARVRTGAPVRELRRTLGGWRVVLGGTHAPEVLDADAVVLAVPAAPAARLLAVEVPAAAVELEQVEYASVGLVVAVLPQAAFPVLPSGSGFLVPPVDGRFIKAATYSSLKWDWVGRAAGDRVVLRASVGRHREEAQLQRDDGELAARALDDLAAATGLRVAEARAAGADVRVVRWGGALPQYAVGHRDRVARVRAAVAAAGRLAVCGAAYDGVGVAACIAAGQRAAAEIRAALAPAGGRPEAATRLSTG